MDVYHEAHGSQTLKIPVDLQSCDRTAQVGPRLRTRCDKQFAFWTELRVLWHLRGRYLGTMLGKGRYPMGSSTTGVPGLKSPESPGVA